MKEIFLATVAIVIIAIATSFALDTMDWSAATKLTTTNVRL